MKMKTVFLLMLLLLAPEFLTAQSGYVTITGTIPTYAGGQVTGSFVNQNTTPQLPLLDGSIFPTTIVTNLDVNGTFTSSVADNLVIQPTPSQWTLILCSKPGNPSQPCYPVTLTITCVGNGACVNGTLDISSAFANAPPPPLPPGSLPAALWPGQILTSVTGGAQYTVQGQIFYQRPGDTISTIESRCSTLCTYYVTNPQTITLASNHTLSSHVNLQFLQGGMWTVNGSGNTLTIPGIVAGTLTQHFAGTSTIQLGTLQTLLPVEWFGAVADFNGTTGTDNLTALQTSINALSNGQILLQAGKYATSNTLNITRSNIGIKGTIPGGAIGTSAVTTTLSPSVIVNTSSTADTVDVAGQSPTAMVLYNQFDHFALERSVAPTDFHTAGLSLNYAAGTIVEYLQSHDSARNVYIHASPGFGIGIIRHVWAGWGYIGVTETDPAIPLEGFYLDSADGNAENSLTIDESTATSPLSNTLTTYATYIQGTAINDVDMYYMGAGNTSYGIYIQTNGGGGIAAQDLHFVKPTLDGCWVTCIFVGGVFQSHRGSVDFDGGWAIARGTAPTVSLANSNGVSVRGMQIGSTGGGDAVLLTTSNGNSVIDNTFTSPVAAYVDLVSSSFNVIKGNSMNYAATSGIAAASSSSHNVMIGNVIGGYGATIGTGILFDSSSQFNIGPIYDNVFSVTVTTPIVDPSGLNGAFIPVMGTVREITGGATSVPTATVQGGAGAGATVTLVTGSNDYNGAITLTTGTSPAASSTLARLTFGTAKRTAPVFTLTPGNAAAANLGVWTNGISNSVVQLNSGSSAPAASTTYVWSYVITGLSQ